MTGVAPGIETRELSAGWLINKQADLVFVVGLTVIGLAAAAAVVVNAALFPVILFWNLWLLGYHHVISTYTRLLSDANARRENKVLLTWVPALVFVAVTLIAIYVGVWAITTTYLYWQWWHYTRQSWGVSRVYERKAGVTLAENPRMVQLTFYALPLWGILWRSSQQHEDFIGISLVSVPVPFAVTHAVGGFAVALLVWLAASRIRAWKAGELPVAHTLYLVSHFVIFAMGYGLIDDITTGWLAINIWHNAQYIGFVWYYNNQRFAGGENPEARILSKLSQTSRFPAYMAACIFLTTVVYITAQNTIAVVVPAIIVFQALNFHHYIVDSFIWKVRKKPMQETLGLTSSKA